MITEEIRQIAEKIKETLDPERIYLFGSYARNQETETSDYDFYVVVDERKEHVSPLLLCDKAYFAIFDIQQKPCDVIVNYKTHFEERKLYPTLEKTVAKEGMLLYEKRA